MKRREFIILSGVGATGASLFSACGHAEEKLIPALIPDDQYVPGIDYWKPSTCGMCPAGCGIVVRTREHKANKIEGNPLHTVNRGALCARGQAGLEVLYNPDRIKGPLKRVGERGQGRWQEIGWEEAIQSLEDNLRTIKSEGKADNIIFATADFRGLLRVAIDSLRSALDAKFWVTQERRDRNLARGYPQIYGTEVTPTFDIANASYLLSFGARFLETWHSPVRYSLAYGEFRRSRGKARGRFVQIEPRMSLTGANADEWLPASVAAEGLVALAIAQVIKREGLAKDDAALKSLDQALDSFKPEETAGLTGLEPGTVIRIAREFASAERPLSIGCGSGASEERADTNDVAVHLLNRLVGNINKPGGVLLPTSDRFDVFDRLPPIVAEVSNDAGTGFWGINELSIRLNNSKPVTIPALLVHNVDPLRRAPRSAEWIRGVSFIASFSSFFDETTSFADLVLPDHTQLERWDLSSMLEPGSKAVVSLVQPVVASERNTKQTEDVLLIAARSLGFKETDAESFQSSESMVKHLTQRLRSSDGKNDGEDSTKTFIESGVWAVDLPSANVQTQPQALSFSGFDKLLGEKQSPTGLTLLCYEHATLGMGDFANLPALQELPDPMTSVIWGSWVEINPKTAASLGVKDGDLVEISTDHGSVRAPAVLYPAIRHDVIAMPYGQAPTTQGKYANRRGANLFGLNPFGIPGEAIAAKVTKIDGNGQAVRFGTDLWHQLETKR